MKSIKGRTSHLIQQQFPELKKQYWGKHFWATGYGVWSKEISQMKWFKNI
jgi:putative transposase